MRIAIVDYSGHPFQVQLSRELARRGHSVLHLHFADFLTPKGRLAVGADDPQTLEIEAITLDRPFAKHSFVRRRFQEVEVGKRIGKRLKLFKPDVVMACNLPLDSLDRVVELSKAQNWPFIFWQQDIYSAAIRKILTLHYGWLGALIGYHYHRMEKRDLRKSAAVVVIADAFVSAIREDFGLPDKNVHVIQNWAPLDEIQLKPKSNHWSLKHGLTDKKVVLYTGTLGMKHDASKLLKLAQALRDHQGSVLVIASEGLSAEWLAREARDRNLSSLVVLPFQPYEFYSEVLASADVLVALLETNAGSFSVPSKVLSYLCAGRPIVISAPSENLAFNIVEKSAAGRAVSNEETDAFISAVIELLQDTDAQKLAASNARAYAEREFDISGIANRFEKILTDVCPHRDRRPLTSSWGYSW